MPLNPNDTLANGQYRILRLLGRGGFGFVYQAQDTLPRGEVVLKLWQIARQGRLVPIAIAARHENRDGDASP